MFCAKCQKDLSECTCPDIEERLARIAQAPGILTKWCVKCDKHHSRCKCKDPEWIIK